jgi:hypothetical protein
MDNRGISELTVYENKSEISVQGFGRPFYGGFHGGYRRPFYGGYGGLGSLLYGLL